MTLPAINSRAVLAVLAVFVGVLIMTASSLAVTTVNVINADAGTKGLTVVSSPNNVLHPNFVTQDTMQSLVTSAYANNRGGVINFSPDNGWVNGFEATSFNVDYGVGSLGSLTLSRVDGGGNFKADNGDPGNTVPTSGTHFLAFAGTGSPVSFGFSQGLSAWGITQLARFGDRPVTMTFTLQDATVVTYAADTVLSQSSTLNWFGFQASEANPIMQVTITSPDGFVRFDDMAFVVAAIPEPTRVALFGLGGLCILLRRRRC